MNHYKHSFGGLHERLYCSHDQTARWNTVTVHELTNHVIASLSEAISKDRHGYCGSLAMTISLITRGRLRNTIKSQTTNKKARRNASSGIHHGH